MEIEYGQKKRDKTLAERGLDFADVEEVLSGISATLLDTRKDYGEDRFITTGLLGNRVVLVVWTKRGRKYRIISMRKANEREQKRFRDRFCQG